MDQKIYKNLPFLWFHFVSFTFIPFVSWFSRSFARSFIQFPSIYFLITLEIPYILRYSLWWFHFLILLLLNYPVRLDLFRYLNYSLCYSNNYLVVVVSFGLFNYFMKLKTIVFNGLSAATERTFCLDRTFIFSFSAFGRTLNSVVYGKRLS